ncbi:MAG TPA: DUF3159 domain-containing protein [Nocardioidaceae bacterium]|nr:DUF3159 domain-containing protein [Nocardioidaceae bacterium]
MTSSEPTKEHHHVGAVTVEAVVRAQMSRALGGRRGMLEAAAPTITFTATYISTKEIQLAVGISVTIAVALLILRLVQRSTVQFVVNSLIGIGIGCFFVWLAARNGGDADEQSLAYFVPGLIYNAVYSVVMVLSIVTRWPVVGFMVGSVAGDPLEWHDDPQVVKLCRNLTWCLVVPCLVRVSVQLPIYLSGRRAEDADAYVAALGIAKLAMGWPLQLAAFGTMVWLLGRNKMAREPELAD